MFQEDHAPQLYVFGLMHILLMIIIKYILLIIRKCIFFIVHFRKLYSEYQNVSIYAGGGEDSKSIRWTRLGNTVYKNPFFRGGVGDY